MTADAGMLDAAIIEVEMPVGIDHILIVRPRVFSCIIVVDVVVVVCTMSAVFTVYVLSSFSCDVYLCALSGGLKTHTHEQNEQPNMCTHKATNHHARKSACCARALHPILSLRGNRCRRVAS